MISFKKTTIITLLACSSIFAQENKTNNNYTRPDSHAPIGVMGDHTHSKGQFMFSYRAMLMSMEGMLNGSDDIDNNGVLNNGYIVTPEKMQMQMHMLGAMYAPSNRVTIMAMASYKANNMDLLVIPMDLNFSTSSSGFGDLKLGALINLIKKGTHKIHANVNLSIPTGSINERDNIPVQDDVLLAYPMQIGSGTWDPSFGTTYSAHSGLFGWGAQAMATLPLGKNDKGYSFGEKGELTTWASIQAAEFISFSTRVKYTQVGDISGNADELTTPFTANNGNTVILANLMPVFSTSNSGRKQLDISIGSNLILNSLTEGLRFGIEVGIPTYQDVNGIQMKNKIAGTAGIQYAF